MTTRSRRRDRGAVTVWVALCSLMLIGLAGLSLDAGLTTLTAHQLQNAADAASLAAAAEIPNGLEAAYAAAASIAAANRAGGAAVIVGANPANAPEGDIVFGRYDRDVGAFTPDANSPNAVRVTARRTAASGAGGLNLIFGGLFGVHTLDVQRSAIAMSEPALSAGVIVLNDSDRGSLAIDSNVRLVCDGAVQVNSSHSRAVEGDSNAAIDAPELNVVGDVDFSSNSKFVGERLVAGAPPIPDPLAALPAPSYGPDRGGVDLGGNQHLTIATGGGYYPDGVTLDGDATLTLAPGIYVVGGPGLRLDSNSRLEGDGVMIYIADGRLDIDSNSEARLTPPDAGPYAGVCVFQARTNTNKASIDSNGDLAIEGTLYFPEAPLTIDSNGDVRCTQLIADKIAIDSDGEIVIDYAAAGAATAHGAGGAAYLVE